MNKKNIIIDCDPGIDDAMAIALLLHRLELNIIGITTVSGNRPLELTGLNAARTLEYFNSSSIPVYNGADKPLERLLPIFEDSSHGRNGLGDADFPEPKQRPQPGAVDFIIKQLNETDEPITILAIGPLTNIAQVIQRHGTGNIGEIFIMGGAFNVKGNVTDFAEFNLYIDPEAAKIVFQAGIQIFCSPLDVTNQITITRFEFEKIRALGTNSSEFFIKTHDWALRRKEKDTYSILWDETAALWLLDITLISGTTGIVSIDLTNEKRGQSQFSANLSSRTTVGLDIDKAKFFNYFHTFLQSAN